MYRLYIRQCEKPHNLTGRKRYRVGLCLDATVGMKPVFKSKLNLKGFLILSSKSYRAGTFVNPTKIVKQYLAARNLQKV